MNPPSRICDFEFPTLQNAEKLSRSSKNQCTGASLKDGSAAVFRQGYIAQLRETHGANMRAVEATEVNEGHRRRKGRILDPNFVNDLMEDVMRQIAEEGELVTKEKVRRKQNLKLNFYIYKFVFYLNIFYIDLFIL